MTRSTQFAGTAVLVVAIAAVIAPSFSDPYLSLVVGDLLSLSLSIAILAGLLRCVRATQLNVRAFWTMLAAAAAFRCVNLSFWTLYEVVLRQPVPELFWWSSIGFLQVMPFLIGLALVPHRQSDEETSQLIAIDLFMVSIWWLFFYLFTVAPWQHVVPNPVQYFSNFNWAYQAQLFCVLVVIFLFWRESSGPWKQTYKHILLAQAAYSIASSTITYGISLPVASPLRYHSGSWYDVTLNLALVYWIWVANSVPNWFKGVRQDFSSTNEPARIWSTVLAAIMVLSLPVFALWTIIRGNLAGPVSVFRMAITCGAAIVLTAALLLKFTLLNRDLRHSVQRSENALVNLKEVQGQLLHAEKLASMSRLVSGTMHEINNPLAAIYGYSDLLAGNESLNVDAKTYVDKIQHHARRTKSIVQDMLAFSRPATTPKVRINLLALLENAIARRNNYLEQQRIEVTFKVNADLPEVMADDVHLTQAVLQIIDNAIFAMRKQETGAALMVATSFDEKQVTIAISDSGPGVSDPDLVFDPFYTTKSPGEGTGLGLSVAYSVVRELGGRMRCSNLPEGGALFEIVLPVANPRPTSIGAVPS